MELGTEAVQSVQSVPAGHTSVLPPPGSSHTPSRANAQESSHVAAAVAAAVAVAEEEVEAAGERAREERNATS